MARTTGQILLQLERQLPDWMRPLRAHLGGIAAMLAHAEEQGETFASAATVGGADGMWLTLLARGHGVMRMTGESDASLRRRLRQPAAGLTRADIVTAVNTILAGEGASSCVMLEPWDEGYFDRDAYFDRDVWTGEHNSFVLVLPLVGDAVTGSDYFDDAYFDDAYFGDGAEHPIYASIQETVNRLRAAGIRWWIYIDVDGDYT